METKPNLIIGKDYKEEHTNGNKQYKNPFDADYGDIITKDILDIPYIDDMAGVLARANIISEEERIAYLRLIKRARKFNLTNVLIWVRDCLASTLARKAFGKTLQIQDKTGLLVPGVIREQISLSEYKGEDKEQVQKRSDFRPDTEKLEVK